MSGEQELVNDKILRIAMKGGLKFAKHVIQFIQNVQESLIEDWEDTGGKVKLEYLKQDGHTVNKVDLSHLEDFEMFDNFAFKHNIQYAITEDPLNPEVEFVWFKANEQETIRQFINEVLEYGKEVEKEIDPEKIIDPEELINRKKEEATFKEKENYTLHEQDFINHEYRIQKFETFNELKKYLAQNYDNELLHSNVDIKSFNELSSVRELNKTLTKMDNPNINLKLDRKPFLEKIKEKTKEMKEQNKEHSKDLIKDKAPELNER